MSFAIRMGYGPDQQDITTTGLEPHSEDKKNGAYNKIALSDMPTMDEVTELSRSQNVTLNTGALGENAKYASHAFTESGCIEGKTRRQPKYRPHRYDRKKSQS